MRFRLLIAIFLGTSCGEDSGGTTTDGGRDAVADAQRDAPLAADLGADFGPDGGCPLAFDLRVVDPPAPYVGSFPRDLEDGVVVGYAADEPFSPFARPLRVPEGGAAELLDVPDANWGFGHGTGGGGTRAAGEYAWTPQLWVGGVRTPLAVPMGYGSGAAHDVNAGDLVVGSFADYDDPIPPNPTGPRPCSWDAGLGFAVQPINTLVGEPLGAAWEVTDTGMIAGAITSGGVWIAARWDGPSALVTPLGGLPTATLSEALGLNALGDVVGRSSFADFTTSAAWYREAEGDWIELPALAGGYAEAFDINDKRWIVGTSAPGDGTVRAVLWIGGAVRRLDDLVTLPAEVQYLSSAVAVDEEGRIAAEAVLAGAVGDLPRTIAVLTPTCP
jgi:hypothetical protein